MISFINVFLSYGVLVLVAVAVAAAGFAAGLKLRKNKDAKKEHASE